MNGHAAEPLYGFHNLGRAFFAMANADRLTGSTMIRHKSHQSNNMSRQIDDAADKLYVQEFLKRIG
jgi:hypothetical protein